VVTFHYSDALLYYSLVSTIGLEPRIIQILVDFHEVSGVKPIYEIPCTSNRSGIQTKDDVQHSSIIINQQQSQTIGE
jgi:hypothetical protein